MVCKLFAEKSASLNESSRTGIIDEPNYQWQMKFINQLLENFKEVYSFFRDNIWVIDLADMQSLKEAKKEGSKAE